MGFRYRKSFTILPWVRLNISGSGLSLSIGPRGKSITIGTSGVFGNLSIGKGLSYRTRFLGGLPANKRTRAFRKFMKRIMTGAIIIFALYQLNQMTMSNTTAEKLSSVNISSLSFDEIIRKGAALFEKNVQTQRSNEKNEEL